MGVISINTLQILVSLVPSEHPVTLVLLSCLKRRIFSRMSDVPSAIFLQERGRGGGGGGGEKKDEDLPPFLSCSAVWERCPSSDSQNPRKKCPGSEVRGQTRTWTHSWDLSRTKISSCWGRSQNSTSVFSVALCVCVCVCVREKMLSDNRPLSGL